MTDFKTLAERVEGLSGPDPDLGREVLLACGYRRTEVGYFLGPLYYWGTPSGRHAFKDDDFHQHDPTRSVDAVLALIGEKLPGASWSCGFVHPDQSDTDDPPGAWGRVCTDHYGHEDEHIRSGATPALALLAATLRALGESHDR